MHRVRNLNEGCRVGGNIQKTLDAINNLKERKQHINFERINIKASNQFSKLFEQYNGLEQINQKHVNAFYASIQLR